MKPKALWVIGGSDCAGYAGVQQDQRTAENIGVKVRTVVTAVTAQNLTELTAIEPVSAELLAQQLDTLLAQEQPEIIKIGLLVSEAQVEQLSAWIASVKTGCNLWVVFDPVMRASAGGALQSAGLIGSIDQQLLPQVDLLMPNWDEWSQLREQRGVSSSELMDVTYQNWRRAGDPQLYIKGGHVAGERSTDYWLSETRIEHFSIERKSVDARGTGCTLSSAVAAYLALGFQLEDALTLAFAYLQSALKCAQPEGSGLSRLGAPDPWPKIDALPKLMSEKFPPSYRFGRIEASSLGLYPVVDSFEWIEKLIGWGVQTLQLRIKGELTDAARKQIRDAIRLAERQQVKLFINDHWAYAIEQGAYGVHLGQEDLIVADLKAIADAGLKLGISTHGFFEIARAIELSPSYIALGHIFETQTKVMPSEPQGVERLALYQRLLKGAFPTVAIGGINETRLRAVKATGVDSIALVTAITEAGDPKAATEHLLMIMAGLERAA